MSHRLAGYVSRGVLAAAVSILVACGGGGGGGGGDAGPSGPVSGSTPTPTPSPNAGPLWVQGVYPASGNFINRCEVVRTGVDIEGNAFPDVQGSTLEEQFYLRSWTNETYLWNTEVVDRDPAGFQTTLDYFDVLKTDETTQTGAAKDNFHFSQPTEDYLAARNSAPRSGYGYRLVALSNTPPRDYRIAYTEPDSPASASPLGVPNFIRGTKILEVDGVDLVNGGSTQAEIDTLNNGLFPASAGEQHTFTVIDPGATQRRTVVINSADVVTVSVNETRVIDTGAGKVGYILFTTFGTDNSEAELAAAMTEMANAGVSDLVLDLRYNGGGYLAVAAQLGYMVAGDVSLGQVFGELVFNNAPSSTNPVTGGRNDPVNFLSTGQGFSLASGTPLDTLSLERVFVLSTGRTCSASEYVINGLRGIDVEVVLIGRSTCGKPFGFYPQSNCGETYYSIQFQGVNAKGFGDFAEGFAPAHTDGSGGGATISQPDGGVAVFGCAVDDDFDMPLGDPREALLAAALTVRELGHCGGPPAVSFDGVGQGGATALSDAGSAGVLAADAGKDAMAVMTTDLTPAEQNRANSLIVERP